MTTIVLTVSRFDYLEKVLSGLELLHCDTRETNLLCIVDGSNDLFVHTRNLVNGSKFENRLTKKLELGGKVNKLDVPQRRARIAAAHNLARTLIDHNTGYVFSVEDDTTFGLDALDKLTRVAINHTAIGMVEGVELGRWGVPYIGAWICNDIYEPTQLKSIEKIDNAPDVTESSIDAGGLYCALIRADLYKQHEFTAANGLGPDVNFSLELRQLGFQNFIAWNVPCTHHYNKMGREHTISPTSDVAIVTMTKESDVKWRVIT